MRFIYLLLVHFALAIANTTTDYNTISANEITTAGINVSAAYAARRL